VPLAHNKYVSGIKQSGLTIYDLIGQDSPLWIPTPTLEKILNEKLGDISLAGLPNRTRSKKVKELVCEALGYPVPSSFRKTQPRFPCQNFDVYNQKSDNLQIWNEATDATRRYVIVKIANDDVIQTVKIVSGDILAKLDTTGTLTQKFQAVIDGVHQKSALISNNDTNALLPHVATGLLPLDNISPNAVPTGGLILSIQTIFKKLALMVGKTIPDHGSTQDRKRGDNLHRLVCQSLGYRFYEDDGQFPDIRHQLLEVKMQTAPTIDLGKILPTDTARLPFLPDSLPLRFCDVRYAIFYGGINNNDITITNFYLVSGVDFFTRFRQFQGNVKNSKIQIHLPADFFD